MVASKLILLPNYIDGSFRESKERKILKDYKGEDLAVIFNASPADLRQVKRSVSAVKDKIKKIEFRKIPNLIKKSMDYYYSEESFVIISRLTGSPYNFVKKSVHELKEWAINLEDYIVMCFNNPDYDKVPLFFKNEIVAYEKYAPSGPVIGILPKNSEAESVYLILQILLSKSPCIIKTPSSLGSSFSSLELIKALNKAIDILNDPELEIIKKSINVVNIFTTERDDIIKKLAVEKSSYVIFGSNHTIEKVESSLKSTNPRKIIKMGTGLSISIVLNDADISFAADEICNSASIDRGNDCVSTNIVYVEDSIFNDFLNKVNSISHKYESKDPFIENNIVGHVHQESVDIIKAKIASLNKEHLLRGLPDTIHLSVIELNEDDHFEEFPGPVLGIRKFKDIDHFYFLFKKDLGKNNIEKNLVSSVFTKDKNLFEQISNNIPSFTFKLNKGSEKMNFLLEHQGTYIIKELLDKKILET